MWLTMSLIYEGQYYKHTHEGLNNLIDNEP